MGHPDVERLQAQVDYLTAVVERMHDGLFWFLDPPVGGDEIPERPDFMPERKKADDQDVADPRLRDYGDPEKLRKVCPKAWGMGREARDESLPMASNPYHDTRGGYRNAWFQGWMERDDELKSNPQDP